MNKRGTVKHEYQTTQSKHTNVIIEQKGMLNQLKDDIFLYKNSNHWLQKKKKTENEEQQLRPKKNHKNPNEILETVMDHP